MDETEDSVYKGTSRRVYFSTIISIALVLLLIGLIGLVGIHAANLARYVKENVVLTVILNEGVSPGDAQRLGAEVTAHHYAKKIVYISKDSAAKTLSKDIGEDFIRFLGYNPLSPSLEIYLKDSYSVRDSISEIKTDLLSSALVKEVNYQQALVESVNHNVQVIMLILAGFASILLLVAVSIVFVTVRLAIYARRFLIKSMQLVGATRGFIRKPFLGIGILNGFLAGIVATLLLGAILFIARRQFPELVRLQDATQFIYVFVGILFLGVLLSFISTFFAVSRYLRLEGDKLYY